MPHDTKSLPQKQREQQVIIPDRPIDEDYFDGAHSKIAETIVRTLINPKQDGVSIGLEGVRGSGKSTIINMVKRLIGESNQDKNIALITIDAWSHSGNHLRRACIESMAESLGKKGWLNTDKWGLKLGNKDKPAKLSTGIATLIATCIGIWFLLPKKVQNEYGTPIFNFISDLLPQLVWGSVAVILAVTVIFRHRELINLLKAVTGKVSDIEIDSASSQADDSSWRFQQWFEELTSEALKDRNRKLVIIFDNLDRISKDEAIATWKTLQIFFEKLYQNQIEREHLQRIFFINCYDKKQLTDGELEHFEKLIHTRVVVPPLIIDHWQTIARKIFAERGFADFEIDEIIQSVLKVQGRNSPSPRDIVRCANELRMLSYQHTGTPIRHLLFYWYELNHIDKEQTSNPPMFDENKCAFDKLNTEPKRSSFLQRLRERKLRIPEENILGMSRDVAIETYAEIHFSLPKHQALQALLHEPIYQAFQDSGFETLERLSRDAVGYQTVLHLELEQTLSTYTDYGYLNKLVLALYGSETVIPAHEECIDIFAGFLPLEQTDLYQDFDEVEVIANSLYLLIEKLSAYPQVQQDIIESFSRFSFNKDGTYKSNPQSWVSFICHMNDLLNDQQKQFFKPVLQGDEAQVVGAIKEFYTICTQGIDELEIGNTLVSLISFPSAKQLTQKDWNDTENLPLLWFLVQKNAFESEEIYNFFETLISKGEGAVTAVPLLLSNFAKGSSTANEVKKYFQNGVWVKSFLRRQKTLAGQLGTKELSFVFPFILQTLKHDPAFISWISENSAILESIFKHAGCSVLEFEDQEVINPHDVITQTLLQNTDERTSKLLEEIYLNDNPILNSLSWGGSPKTRKPKSE